MRKTLKVYKRIGETPLEAINRLKKKNPLYLGMKISYAGRLDPMASGQLLLLLGEENKNRVFYEKKDKEYVFEVLFGVSTDSDDVLGLVQKVKLGSFNDDKLNKAMKVIKKKTFQYPPLFSSVLFKGKPLYYWARQGKKAKDLKLVKRKIKIYEWKLLKTKFITIKSLASFVKKRITLVKGDFRQKEILLSWEKNLKSIDKDFLFKIVKVKVKCSSGTYVRSMAKDLGKILNIPSLAFFIKRTKIY